MARGTSVPNGKPARQHSKYQITLDGTAGPFDWDLVNPEILGEAAINVLRHGDAFMVSTTSDGGAVRCTVFEGDAKHHQYSSDPAALEVLLKALSQALD